MGLWKQVRFKVQEHLIKPIMESHAPIPQASLGAAVGMFWGLTPTVGIQMWLVWVTWLFLKFSFHRPFDLLIGTAMVWISNPLTMFFMYYGFLITGYHFFNFLGIAVEPINYDTFTLQLSAITENPALSTFEVVEKGFEFLLIDLGFPMIIGSLFYAIPCAFLSYFVASKYLLSVRMQKAARMGIAYEDWRTRFEHSPDRADLMLRQKHHKKHSLRRKKHVN